MQHIVFIYCCFPTGKLGLTARYTNQAEVKAGSNDRVYTLTYNIKGYVYIHQRTKGTLGITGLYLKRVHIDLGLGYIDVVLSQPSAETGTEG